MIIIITTMMRNTNMKTARQPGSQAAAGRQAGSQAGRQAGSC